MDELEDGVKNQKVEKFKKRFRKSEKLPSRISDTFDHAPTESEFEKILAGEGKTYFGIGSMNIELDGNCFDVRYCDLSKEVDENGKKPTIPEVFEKQLGEKVNDEELDDILIGKFERGEYKIFGTTENGHKSEQGAPILNIKRKTNEINKTNEHVENESNKEKFEKDLLSQNITEKYLNINYKNRI